MANEIVLFETKDKEVKLSVPVEGDTVWLTQDQMSELFETARCRPNQKPCPLSGV